MKAKWPNHKAPIGDFTRFLNEGTTPMIPKKSKSSKVWFNPMVGCLKFNIDGSFKGCPGDSSIGGILRNKFGEVLVFFSKSIGITDSNKVEQLAVREIALIYAASKWCSSHVLVIDSDNYNIVK
ncbi:Uncharacterized protein TCM_018867 [Theobroma cacao]|uniref:RNase H type-1 domain-containing protein n=1 Tax=Theobroma cacao TaxID=3641 RepID=A0A061EFG5_THECC|nr:Uncharacterized protein TCM_018867 [Theobroma cacao]